MTELKTLKDIEHISSDCIRNDCDSKELRLEAIKYIKEFNDLYPNGDWTNRKVIHFHDSGVGEYSDHAFRPVINWIKHFFNIKEEELR
jgi:hypothetical protein